MIAEIGLLLLIIALVISASLSLLPLFSHFAAKRRAPNKAILGQCEPKLNPYIALLTHLNTLALCGAFAILVYVLVVSDFSVAYVANHSNTQLPMIFKVAAAWGGHEGSMLLWIVATAVLASIFVVKNRNKPQFCSHFSAAIALILLGFLAFLLFTSNPFERLLPNIPVEGRDLNPILQDIGLVFHPPLLFMGYVGLTICFAATIACLLDTGKQLHNNMLSLRPWALFAWITLTGGNAFGSWWAYNELGWGGWWFWDPVENASFIPWLVATAYVHSLWLTQTQRRFYASTAFIGLLGFSLCLLGTFLVRSGVVQSVHAFASDPSRGISILTLLFVSCCGGYTLFVAKYSMLANQGVNNRNAQTNTAAMSVFLGILLLVIAALSVLLGTCYPLIFDVLFGRTISVGAPYFNSLFIPMVALISIVMGLAPCLRFKQQASFKPIMLAAAAISFGASLAVTLPLALGFQAALGVFAACFLAITLGYCAYQAIKTSQINSRFIGMFIAHLGLVVSIIGATVVSNFEQEELLRMGPGQGKELAGYTFIYRSTEQVSHPSYEAIQANIEVQDSLENTISFITPQRRTFNTNAMQLSAAGVYRQWYGDLYVSMGQALSDSEYLIRINYKPLVSWIWLGAILMMFGGVVSMLNKALVTRRQYSVTKTSKTVKQEATHAM
ncbi:heme lyase CcmF/NrfE family subunit [Shewanella maritima]|uniref:Heme lyase CcmF/NrfE family subunit n=1 Tax=Shewanella maritima TaxID=2520507 RepID=A0A411PI17_9GAMM|nr:heme lyase CcmF/NrfE family subunit [Shewanella maritima]QBF83002.1 heme lyase CcmF/NrfE family subunit [Shewanella maritima]